MGSYFFFVQGEKRKRCLASVRLFNAVQRKNNKQKNVHLLMYHSLVQLVEGINFTGTDSLMPPTVLKLQEPVDLKARATATINAKFAYGASLDEAVFEVI